MRNRNATLSYTKLFTYYAQLDRLWVAKRRIVAIRASDRVGQ